MPTDTSSEIIRLDVRVNPQNGDWTQDNPEYRQNQIEEAARLKAGFVELIKKEAALEIETDLSESPASTEGDPVLFRAHRATQRVMTLRGALGGYGLAGKIDSLGFHGVADIHWTLDNTVPVGDFRIEGSVEDRAAIFERLMKAIP
jgi:hypothetical protein